MGGGWQAARAEPLVDEPTRAAMRERSDWKGLIDAPLPPADTEFFPSPTETP